MVLEGWSVRVECYMVLEGWSVRVKIWVLGLELGLGCRVT